MTEPKLLPCPFCGEHPFYADPVSDHSPTYVYCQCETHTKQYDGTGAMIAAAAAWNTRSVQAAAKVLLEKLPNEHQAWADLQSV